MNGDKVTIIGLLIILAFVLALHSCENYHRDEMRPCIHQEAKP